jgi:amino acid adenylation domain-containing protein/non-ribosomal peptide synthase protein (TIGR01720 family)
MDRSEAMNPTTNAGRVYVFPASYSQRSLWFLDQFIPGSSLYNLHTATRLSSRLNVSELERSINEIIRRHESLRTAFKAVNGEPVQMIAPILRVELPVVDLRQLPDSEREDEALRLATAEARRPFNLAEWPLLRTSLLRMGDEDYILLVTMHHIVCDFWSMNVFQRELSTHYEAFCRGLPSPLPELPVQYADFSEWAWQWSQGPSGKSCLDYWKKQLADLQALQLPTDWPRPQTSSFEGAEYNFWIAESLYNALQRLSQQEKVTLFMTMLAAFQTLLHRYTDQTDIAVGTPVANRNRAEVENLLGFFVNSIVLRTDLSGNPTFRELLARVRKVALDAYAHQDLPFERLVYELKPERAADHNPLFQVHFQLLNDEGSADMTGPLVGDSMEVEASTAKFDLALDLWECPDGLWAHLEYSTDLFREETIARIAGHFCTLLDGIVTDPDKSLAGLPLLSDDEQRQVLIDWNHTETDYPKEMCLHQLFEEQVERTPDATALVFRKEALTYRALNNRSNQLANYLQSLGIGPEVLVAICAERSPEAIVGLLGILKAGGAYLPLDPKDGRERRHFMMKDAEPQMLLTQRKLVDTFPSIPSKHLCLDTDWHKVAGWSDSNPISRGNSQNLAYVIYTSGSTGKPKGVMVHSQAVCNHLLWMQSAFPLTARDGILQKYSFSFDPSLCEIFGPMLAGARLILAEPSEYWDISQFLELLQEHEITVLDLVPSMLEALLEMPEFWTCSSLRRVICGGEILSPDLRDRFFARMNAELHNIYGPTEATIGATYWTCLPEHTEQSVPIGRPIANTQVYILDSNLNPLPVGVAGELCIGGDGLARGYLGQPHLTSEKFIANPFGKPDARLYKTGDRARLMPDGNIEYLGRIDRQVKVRGHRVELGEIEGVLARHASVQACSVLPAEDERGDSRLVAYMVPVPDQSELWPSLGEYDVYDELLYYAMTHDETRNRSYRAAINRTVRDKVVLDIGTGADAILARFCVGAGAQRVYAIEVYEDAYRRARELIQSLGLTDRIVLIHGESTEVQLPERVDVCVSEILGTIGSSEGVISILNDARRFLKDDGTLIPRRCVTRFAPVSLPENLARSLRLNELPTVYVEQVFKRVGHPFDLRMCIKSFSSANILSHPVAFEDLDFTNFVRPEQESDTSFTITRKSRFDGFLLWLNLYPEEGELIDSLNNRVSWLPVFFPAFWPGLEVSEGDVIEARWSRRLGSGDPMPDYTIEGVVRRRKGEPVVFAHNSPYRSAAFRNSPFYESLFAHLGAGQQPPELGREEISQRRNGDGQLQQTPEEPAGGLVPDVRRFLRERLPEYMIPTAFVVLDDLPLMPNGKPDYRKLPVPDQSRSYSQGDYAAPRNETEEILAGIWSELLDVARVGIHDNFFELGGDSILSIQIIARANQAGLRLRPAQLFQHQTIAEIAAVVGLAPVIESEQGVLTDAVPLAPVQHWFFEQDFADPHHYNQSMLIETPSAVDAGKLGLVLERLITHHDALRLRFTLTESGWRQVFGAAGDAVTIARLDLSTLSEAKRDAELQKAAAELQASLDLRAGPLLQALLIDVGDSNATYLLLVIHHLVVDVVSWRIFLEDFWTAYYQLVDGEEIQLPPKTTSFQRWAHRLTEYAQSAQLEKERGYWLELLNSKARYLPTDYPEGANTAASARTVVVTLGPEETQAVLQDIPKAYRTQINDVLLTALVQAFTQWTGDELILVDVEGHGREDVIEDVDLSRTIGWFTSIFPVCLELRGATNPGDALRLIKEQLRKVPRRGIGHGLLRYLGQNAELRDALATLPRPEVAFNYMGQFGRSQSESSYWKRLAELTGPNLSPRGHRPNLLEIDASVTEGCLEIIWTYSEDVHRRSTIETLAGRFVEALRELIHQCDLSNSVGFTASDFSKARLSQKELDKLISKLQ